MPAVILNKKQTWEFLTALRGREEIPLKLEYIGRGAKHYLKILYSGTYKSFNAGEMKLIKTFLPKIIPFMLNKNPVYIGCGDGSKMIIFLKELVKQKGVKQVHLLDISNEMLNIAERNIRKRFKKMKVLKYNIDFEAGDFPDITACIRKSAYPHNFYLFLGTTLGNLSNRERILTNFRESMTLEDNLLIGVELVSQDIKSIIKRYSDEFTFKWLLCLLSEIGITRKDGEFLVEYNHDKHQIETSFILNKSKEYVFADEVIYLEEGHKILLAISHKFTIAEIKNLVRSTGYKVRQIFTDKEYRHAIVIVTPAKLSLENNS